MCFLSTLQGVSVKCGHCSDLRGATSMSTTVPPVQLRPVIAAEQIQRRVKEMARQIYDDYRGQLVHALAVLENVFMFRADLVRATAGASVVCTFIKPKYSTQVGDGAN